ncbi:carbohydrate-binding module 1 protein [Tulasnella sp. 403]|nr:carbohydrate-binding module 1 protein [Tulasnella sp. 403]
MSTTPPQSTTPSLVADSTIVEDETNTLILTSLSPTFFNPEVLDALRDHFSSYGELHTWAPLKGFRRIVMVYWSNEDAARAREECDGMVLADENDKVISNALRVYRGTYTDLSNEVTRLPVPHTTKNFLISPPGSPPVGWEPAEEEAPNAETLAADLIAALHRLQLNRAERGSNGIQLILSPDDDLDADGDVPMQPSGSSKPGLTVFLEDTDFQVDADGDSEGTASPTTEGVWQGEMIQGGIGRVKATVASMHRDGLTSAPGSGVLSPGAGKIARVPTPRPPLHSE